MSDKGFYIVISIVILLIIAVFLGSIILDKPLDNKNKAAIESTDCKNDFDCFIKQTENCNKASVNKVTSISLFGVNQTTESYLELRGEESNKCLFYQRMGKTTLEFPPEVPESIVKQQRDIYNSLEGLDGICKFNKENLTKLFINWKNERFSSEDYAGAECEGRLYNNMSISVQTTS